MKKNSKKVLLMGILVVIMIVVVTGVSLAFFNYTRTGVANTISVGRISFTTNQTNTITLTNLFPINPAESGIMDDNTKVGTFTLTIQGDTDYAGGVEYLVSTANTSIYTGTGKFVPISLDVTVTDLGTPTDSYFTARNAKDATIYKRLSGNSIIGDQQLLVGYIKPNTTLGTAEGVNGSITIKAYLDQNKIAISDTYNENRIVTDNLGTTSEWVDDRTVLTTTEWNALRNNGISFQVKVEANEGIWVDEPIYNKLRVNAVMDNIASTNVTSATGIDFSKISGDTDNDGNIDNGEGLYVRAGTENDAYPVVYYRGAVEYNNVYFAGKCWQIIRTTDTGGTKMIYNGKNTGTESEPTCENTTGASRQITLNIEGTDTNTFAFSGTGLNNSPAYNGYMYGTVYSAKNEDYAEGSKFGNGVTWDGEGYTMVNVSETMDAYHHYTCGTSGTTSCNTIRYYFANNEIAHWYFMLSNGKTIENVVEESLQNGNNESTAKAIVEQWYEENIENTQYKNQVEDTIYCNDRSIYSLGGMNPNGGVSTSASMVYSGYQRNYVDYNPSTKCNRVADSFTKESTNGNGLLDYSVGLITIDEIAMAGGKVGTANANFYLKTGVNYYSLSPNIVTSSGIVQGFYEYSSGAIRYGSIVSPYGLRPVISLKSDTSIADGLGTAASPYIIK